MSSSSCKVNSGITCCFVEVRNRDFVGAPLRKLVSRRVPYCHHLSDKRAVSLRLHFIFLNNLEWGLSYATSISSSSVDDQQNRWLIDDSLSPLADWRAELCDLWKWRWWAMARWARRAFWSRTRRTSFQRNMCQQCKPPICALAIIADDLIRFRSLRRFDNHACTITVDSKEYSLTLWWEDCTSFAE